MQNEPDKVSGKASHVQTNDERQLAKAEAGKEVAVRGGGAMGALLAQAVENARDTFGFEQQFVLLDSTGAYAVHGKVAPYGQGALMLGRRAGVYVHTPEDLIGEDGIRHKNPYIIRNQDGVIVEANYRKAVVHMNEAGHIKYKDFVFSRSITVDLARRAMKLMREPKVPANAKRFATRAMVEKWNAETEKSGEPGKPIWLFYELPNNPAGIAVNTNDPSEHVLAFIEGNIELENYFKSSTETKAERRAIWYVIPESFVPLTGEHAPKLMGDKVESAWFRVMAPTKAGILLAMLQKLMMAIMSEDEEAVLKAKEAFAGALNVEPAQIKVVEADGDAITDPERVEAQWEHDQSRAKETPDTTGELAAPAKNMSLEEFRTYMRQQWAHLNDEEKEYISTGAKKNGIEGIYDADGIIADIEKLVEKIDTKLAPKFATAMRKIIKMREAEPDAEASPGITPKQAREYITIQLTEGNTQRTVELLIKHGVKEGTDISAIPDETVVAVYNSLTTPEADPATGQLKLT